MMPLKESDHEQESGSYHIFRIPSVFPRISQHLLLTLFQVPLCISLERSPSWRARAMISQMTNSATLRELLKGELNTAIPCSAAYCRSTWFVPIQKQPITMRLRASFRTRSVNLVFERIPITWTSLLRYKNGNQWGKSDATHDALTGSSL
jgi:hypothetical protein